MKTKMGIEVIYVLLGLMFFSGVVRAEWTEPVSVDEVNTELVESQPFLSFDGLTLYFNRRVNEKARIYAATRDEPSGPFTSVAEVLSSSYHVVSPWVSPDNLRMYYHNELPSGWLLKVRRP